MGTQSISLYRKPLKFMYSFWNLHGKVSKEQHILLLSLETLLFARENICVWENFMLLELTKKRVVTKFSKGEALVSALCIVRID